MNTSTSEIFDQVFRLYINRNYPTAMATNVLTPRDTNAQVKPMSSPEKDAEKKDSKSLDYHRQVLQSRLDNPQ